VSRNRTKPIPPPRFDGPDAPGLLLDIHRYVLENAQREVSWYAASLGSKRRWSLVLRGCALLFAAAAAALPLVNTALLEATTGGFSPLPTTLVTLFLALASGLVVYDKFWGFSSGWLRYMKTRQMLDNRIEAFHLDWAAAWSTSDLKARDPAPFFPLARAFLDDINLLVGEETNAWIQEFSSSLQGLEAQIEKKRAEKEAKAQDFFTPRPA